MKLTMERMRVIMRATHSKFRRTEGELIQKNICKTLKNRINSKKHLQDFKKYLIYIHKTLSISFVD